MIDLKSIAVIVEFFHAQKGYFSRAVAALTAEQDIKQVEKEEAPYILGIKIKSLYSYEHPEVSAAIEKDLNYRMSGCTVKGKIHQLRCWLEQMEESGICSEDERLFLALCESECSVERACDAYEFHHVEFWEGWTLEELAAKEYAERYDIDPDELEDPDELDDPDKFYDFLWSMRLDLDYDETEYGVIFVDR